MPWKTALAIPLLLLATAGGAEAPPHKIALGSSQPGLDFRLLDGRPTPSWKDLHGSVVILDFWAVWCAPCVATIPHLNALQEELKGEAVHIFSVTYEPTKKVQEFLLKHPISTEVGVDNDLATFSNFVAWGIPISVVLNQDGVVVAVVSPRDLNAEVVRQAIAGKALTVKEHPGWDDPAGAAKYFREQLEKDRATYGND